MRKYIGEIGLTITAIIWGSGFVASAVALEYYTPYQLMAGRFLIGALILCLIFNKKLGEIKRKTLIKGAILGSLFTRHSHFKRWVYNLQRRQKMHF